ncbi:MAG: response regulator [Candidatus Omnitrophica bacterium]|nr:response regulator [Candidatus Omnitrophota bacterium]
MRKDIKIMLADDEEDFRKPLSFWLESKGYSVDCAENGEIAIKMIQENTPNIVLLDLNMPVLDGLGTLKRIREFNKDLPVIIISAYVDDPRVREANAYGISGVFYKGKDFKDWLSLLETALRMHKKLKKNNK